MHLSQLFKHWTYQVFAPGTLLRRKYEAFKSLLHHDAIALELIADLEELFYGETLADRQRANHLAARLTEAVGTMAGQLVEMNPTGYMELPEYFRKIDFYVRMALELDQPEVGPPYILSLEDAASFPRLVGGKACNLGRATQVEGVPIPPGLVVTANAFNYFIDYNDLSHEIEDRLRQMVVGDRDLLARLTGEMQELILAAEVPEEIARGIRFAVSEIIDGDDLIAVRSSALAEDGEISFAGQYASELNVQPNDVLEAYKRVLAGKYCPRAVSYRISNGLTDSDTAMAVLIIPMVDADNAGVVYSRDPDCRGGEAIGVYGVCGLGEGLVDGSVSPGKAVLTREEVPLLDTECTPEEGGLPRKETLEELGRLAMVLEDAFGAPQDIEWAEDVTGKLFILQTRPLQEERDEAVVEHEPVAAVPLADGLERASSGVGCGEVYYAPTGEKIALIPDGAIVMTPSLKPSLLTFIGRMNGVIASTGSRASHFASVARESGVPVLVGELPTLPESGQVLTVDGSGGRVFEGCVTSLLTRAKDGNKVSQRVVDQYSKVVPITVKLNLTDPKAEEFSPEGCRSMHDVVRFCHEKAVGEMFSIVDKRGRGMGAAKRLKTDLPLVMYLLDLGEGFFSGAAKEKLVTPPDIKSRPMWALWYGLSDERVEWPSRLTHMDWEEFDKVSGGIFSFDSKLLASYGLISEDYLHLMIRFGYHFSVVDAVCSSDEGRNYINFRFKGGGAGFDQRLLRLEFIRAVLERYGFETSTRGDMIDAKCSRLDENGTRLLLARLGYLMAVTRLMDMRMETMDHVESEVERFITDAEHKNAGMEKA
ncbi:PEP/pyruvate-binding domain-containing protein [Pseudodesulfovibrio piezophilus]|uniref:Phosphoenolpyruvate synthase n=1 Tax=Pseudodesulfovibrio piezophilus (strain DSM 21447 / JCM 15486 / C1TLV30) TaxID=1322246 RepID=M1WN40_PSEP2|nr:PEP/pyruvate-binding domain-containing protein [Pseudodesulfovibrio piezophilus]CCH50150.1 Pyruvate phosphate dikinase PEP/pyruvate-binding [Pseudodesulfovibrio piezophilus C1TLV30]